MTSQPVRLIRFIAIFAIAQAAAILVNIGLLFVDIDVGTGGNVGGTVASAVLTAYLFVRRHGRAPDRTERRRLTWLCFAVSWVISVTVIALLALIFDGPTIVALFTQLLDALPHFLLVGIVLFVLALYFVIFYLSFGWYANVAARSFTKRRGAL